eukprot:4071802-Ditylum_brightwellii.AAC.1
MFQFYGIILRMSIEPQHLGRYEAYFQPTTKLRYGPGYVVELKKYSGWATDIVSLAHFYQIRSAFYPEIGKSSVSDKCHQLRYLMQSLNCAAGSPFDLGPNATFDEG